MKRFNVETKSATPVENTVCGDGWRISVLLDRLVRVETGEFCDLPTQCVWYRDLCNAPFRTEKKGAMLVLDTGKATFYFDTVKKKMSKIKLSDGREVKNFSKGVLPGTRRTLDMTNGKVRLGKSVVSRNGVAVFDDSSSLVLDGEKIGQRGRCSDRYYFAYGNDYRGAIAALYGITGFTPLLPKFVFGNWWSRYKAYSQDEYVGLMQKFIDEKIPFTVATVDMDWHWVDVVARFGKEARPTPTDNLIDRIVYASMPGWTGYSWNRDLFPDYRKMLDFLNANGFKVTLNLHPAQGVRFFEDQYENVCRICGVDPATRKQVSFSLADERYLQAYFDVLHRPYQDQGVRFWWIDWQQGKNSDVRGLDPLWALNHYHTLDMRDYGKRPVILSRYAGIGSHRYPIGFSGDSAMTWETLDFQPYMTASATNVGYTWWSHDIGGHHMGYKDDELYLRWLQFGVFSPINRLHSTSNEFMGKEPWNTSKATMRAATEYLRFRHRLIPYLYSVNYLTATEGRALCEPMYYSYDCEKAYKAKNQYSFGTQLVVAPITRRTDPKTKLAHTSLWVPEGEEYTDIFTGRKYQGGTYEIYRDAEDFPVFAKAGSIIPLYRDAEDNSLAPDKPLEIWIYAGDGGFVLYEDDGDSLGYENGEYCKTRISVAKRDKKLGVTLSTQGDMSVLPAGREITLVFRDVEKADVSSDAKISEITPHGKKEVRVTFVYDGKDTEITLDNCEYDKGKSYEEELIKTVSGFQCPNLKKSAFYRFLGGVEDKGAGIPSRYYGPIKEIQKMRKYLD